MTIKHQKLKLQEPKISPIIAALFGVPWISRYIGSISNIYEMHTIQNILQRAPPNQNTIPIKLIRINLPKIHEF